jgi:nitronate monooxygenase
MSGSTTFTRIEQFCRRFGMTVPVMLAPMAGVPAPALSIAVANAGGLGACGVLTMEPSEVLAWASQFRAGSGGGFQLNTWIPDPAPLRSGEREAAVRRFLEEWGPPISPNAGDAVTPSFETQCAAMLRANPRAISSVMGIFPAAFVEAMKARGIPWFAVVTTVSEARHAASAGADVIVAQGSEAGGHRGAFDPAAAGKKLVGLVSLVPAIVDAVDLPVVATGGIADGRAAAAAFALGASAVQIGTGFLRAPEAGIHRAWADALGRTLPEQTVVSRAFSGRPGRSIATRYVEALLAHGPEPAPYPVQRGLTAAMRRAAVDEGDVERMQAWAGQSAALAMPAPAGEIVARIWSDVQRLLA